MMTVVALLFCGAAFGAPVPFTLLTHPDNVHYLAQPTNSYGDHLVQTDDDFYAGTLYPDGSFSFNFMDRDGTGGGYATGVHPLTGTLELDIDLHSGGAFTVDSLHFDGYAYANSTDQYLATGDECDCVDGLPNSGSYSASADSDWAFTATIDWYYDVPYGGPGTIDMVFDDYGWAGFLIPVSELTAAGMAATSLDDPLGYYAEDFESWLWTEVASRLPVDAKYLLFVQGEAVVTWSQTPLETGVGIAGETIMAYTTVPEPASIVIFALGLCGIRLRTMRRRSGAA